MAQPSSSHHDESRHRHRSERSSHHHHRTVSSTTLLLILSLVLAVLAVMLSLPSSSTGLGGGGTNPAEPVPSGVWNYLTPKRTQQLLSRESTVAVREAEVARREAELLAGAPGGVIAPTPSPIVCPVCTAATSVETVFAPAQTVIKEIVKEDSLTPPGWTNDRIDDILVRELKIADREREIGKREEAVNRREHDASRREAWIMEQLIALGNDSPVGPGPAVVEDEYIYEQPPPSKRKAKYLPQYQYQEPPPLVVSEVQYETQTQIMTVTETLQVPPPASTRQVAYPTPVVAASYSTTFIPKTTAVEIITEEQEEEEEVPIPVPRPRAATRRPPAGPGWFGGW